MHKVDPVYLEHQLKRWMRPDAHRFIRPDWRRYVTPGSELASFYERYERKYSPEQPRVPAGSREGGRWTDGTPAGSPAGAQTTELSAQRRRGSGPKDATPGQAARLTVAEAQARDAISRVRELDRNWTPTPSTYETVEGQIAAAQAETQQAQARLRELANVGVGPGPFAGDSIPAGPNVTAADRRELNRIGSETGCHTCGTLVPGTASGNFVADHQPPTALNSLGLAQRLYPQCTFCSVRQGGWVSFLKGRR